MYVYAIHHVSGSHYHNIHNCTHGHHQKSMQTTAGIIIERGIVIEKNAKCFVRCCGLFLPSFSLGVAFNFN